MFGPRRVVAAVLAIVVALAAVALAAPATFADNTVTGTLAASPNPSTGVFNYWTFLGPTNGSTVTLTLTYSPNGTTLDRTNNTYDSLVGFNVYGDDGTLFGQSTLTGTGVRSWSFQSNSAHQYTVQVENYIENSPVQYSLAATGVSLAAQPTATPTPNYLAPQPTITPAPTVTPLPSSGVGSLAPTTTLQSGVLAKSGDQVQGHLVGALINTVADYQVTATADGSPITLQLTAQQGSVIGSALAGVNVYQMQGGVKVLIAVGLPSANNPDISVATFPGAAHGYGDFIAEVYNGSPGSAMDYTLTRQ